MHRILLLFYLSDCKRLIFERKKHAAAARRNKTKNSAFSIPKACSANYARFGAAINTYYNVWPESVFGNKMIYLRKEKKNDAIVERKPLNTANMNSIEATHLKLPFMRRIMLVVCKHDDDHDNHRHVVLPIAVRVCVCLRCEFIRKNGNET